MKYEFAWSIWLGMQLAINIPCYVSRACAVDAVRQGLIQYWRPRFWPVCTCTSAMRVRYFGVQPVQPKCIADQFCCAKTSYKLHTEIPSAIPSISVEPCGELGKSTHELNVKSHHEDTVCAHEISISHHDHANEKIIQIQREGEPHDFIQQNHTVHIEYASVPRHTQKVCMIYFQERFVEMSPVW